MGSKTLAAKILVLFPGALGDFICFLPALERLAAGREVDLLARAEYAGLPPASVGMHSLERYEINRLFLPGAEQDERVRRFFDSYASIFSWMGSSQPDFLRHLELLSHGELKLFPFLPSGSRAHAVDYYLSCLGEKPMRGAASAVALKPDALSWGSRFWRDNGLEERKVLVLAPGSGAKEKNWPAESYKALAVWWEERFGGKALILVGPVEDERGERGRDWDNALVISGLELAKAAALLSRCDLYVGNDSGVTHLAAAAGVETVALFGPTDPRQWAPRGKRVAVITRSVECSPCPRSVMKACPHRKCLTDLSPDDVIGALEEVIERSPGAVRKHLLTVTGNDLYLNETGASICKAQGRDKRWPW